MLLNIPAAKSFIGDKVADALGDRLHTSVTIEQVSVPSLNRIIIDDITIYDQEGNCC